MKYGDILHGTITSVDQKGRGVFEYTIANGEVRRVAVPFTFPGDVIDATFVKRDAGMWIARLERVHEGASDRVEAPCPHANVCGGCLWQALSYEGQLKLKEGMLQKAYADSDHFRSDLPLIRGNEGVSGAGGATPLSFRNRMDYAVGWKGELGLKEYGSWNRYLNLSTCLLLDKTTPVILDTARRLAQELAWEPWDARRHTGQFRYVIVRLGRNTGQRLIHLLVSDAKAVSLQDRAKLIEAFAPLCTSLILGENTKPTDVSYAESCEALHGALHLEEEVNGVRYRIHPNAFFQTNTVMASVLQTAVLDELGDVSSKHVLDLYGGIGFFGIALAKRGATVFGQELDAFAVSEALVNAEQNFVMDRCTFLSGAVEALPTGAWRADAAIIDPPRAGLHPKALRALIEHGPARVVYVSCNYHSFLKEWPELEKAYTLERVQAFDLFPHTPHMEVVHTLRRRASNDIS